MKTTAVVLVLLALALGAQGQCDKTAVETCESKYKISFTTSTCSELQALFDCGAKACPDRAQEAIEQANKQLKEAGRDCVLSGAELGKYPSLFLVAAAFFLTVFLRG